MLGGGQLGWYALIAAKSMGYRTFVLEPDPDAPAGRVADVHLCAGYDDADAIDLLGRECDVVTVEFENPPSETLARLSGATRVAPSPQSVAIAQDRIAEKEFLIAQNLPVGSYTTLGPGGPRTPVRFPAILKTARLGYDGKGQRRVSDAVEAEEAWRELGSVVCVLEEAMTLDFELSAIVARSDQGETAIYDIAMNHHVDGILDSTSVPAIVDDSLVEQAREFAIQIAEGLSYVGVLAVEFFVVDSRLLVNEIAPRPHNSGHWTLDGATTSQFEQQIRAICGIELGDVSMTVPAAAMVNVLGDLWEGGEPDWATAQGRSDCELRLYGKSQARIGRKMGHLTAWGRTPATALALARDARRSLTRRD
jgi:5-(carboxyamino)imidazole ribonucleotide synthase